MCVYIYVNIHISLTHLINPPVVAKRRSGEKSPLYMCMHTSIYTHTYIHIYIYTYIYIAQLVKPSFLAKGLTPPTLGARRLYTHYFVYTYIHTCIHIDVYIYIYIYI